MMLSLSQLTVSHEVKHRRRIESTKTDVLAMRVLALYDKGGGNHQTQRIIADAQVRQKDDLFRLLDARPCCFGEIWILGQRIPLRSL